MSTIITGVDGSATAAEAATTAARLAVATDAQLIVVSAYERLEHKDPGPGGHDDSTSSEDAALDIAHAAIAALTATFPDLRARAQARQGRPADALLASAEAVDASLIVVGNKRVQGVSRVLGSIGTEVLHKATCDVYIAYTHPRD